MTDTAAASGLTVQQWDDKFFSEYFQDRFKELKGEGETSIIQVKEDLSKKKGDSLTFALVNRLTNAAITGVSTLEGSEEDMLSRSFRLYVDKRRNAVRVPEMAEQQSAIGLRAAAKPRLLDWAMEDTRDEYIRALGSINGVTFEAATAAQRNAWLVDNADRVLFGAGVGSFTDHSADLDLLDTTTDIFNTAAVDAMRMKAITCSPKIRPVRDSGNGRRYYVALAHPGAFANLRASMTTTLASTASELHGSKLFEGGDLHWNNVIVKEVDNMPVYADLGDSGTTEVTPVYLLGAQAIGQGICKRWKTITEVFDYGDKHGVAVESIMGIEKLIFGTASGSDTGDTKDNGVVTGYFATTSAANTTGVELS